MLNAKVMWIAFGAYLCFLVVIAIIENAREKGRSSRDFATAANSVPWPILVMTYLASLMSTWVFFAAPGAYYRGGLVYWLSELSYICLFPIIMHFVMNKVWIINRKRNYTTPADFFCDRFKSSKLRVVLAVVFLLASFPYVTSILVAIAKAANVATGGEMSYQSVVCIFGLVIVLYVCIGGMKSIALSDTIQGLIYVGLLWFIVIACLVIGFGGSLPTALNTIWENTNSWFSYPGPDYWVPYSARFSYPFCCAIGWTIMLPHVFVRSGYAGDDLKTQRKLMGIIPVLQAFVWTGTMLIGLVAIALIPGLGTEETELIIPYLIQNVIINNHPQLAVVLMIGFFIGAVAVGISTADSFLLVSGSILTEDILHKTFKIKLTDKQNLIITRIVIAVIGVVAVVMAMDPPDLIYTLIMFANAIVMPLFPILVIGIYWKKATKEAALVSAVAGTIVVLLTYFVWKLGDYWYGTFGFVTTAILMIVVSLFTHNDEKESECFYEALISGEQEAYEIVEK